eukprot:scaffold17000_cov39-Phaeocystis_antarctica.AAC.1
MLPPLPAALHSPPCAHPRTLLAPTTVRAMVIMPQWPHLGLSLSACLLSPLALPSAALVTSAAFFCAAACRDAAFFSAAALIFSLAAVASATILSACPLTSSALAYCSFSSAQGNGLLPAQPATAGEKRSTRELGLPPVHVIERERERCDKMLPREMYILETSKQVGQRRHLDSSQ